MNCPGPAQKPILLWQTPAYLPDLLYLIVRLIIPPDP